VAEHPAILTITHGNDIRWSYVLSKTPPEPNSAQLTLRLRGISLQQIQEADEIAVEWYENSALYLYRVEFIANDGDIWRFKRIGDRAPAGEERTLTVNYKETIKIELFDEAELTAYHDKASFENLSDQNSVRHNIKATLKNDIPENRNILLFMLELNNKLDDILDILRTKDVERLDDTDTQFRINCVGLNGRELLFYSPRIIEAGAYAYTHNVVGKGGERFAFASVLRVYPLKKSKDGWFYKGVFNNMRDDTRDDVVKYVFTKEREMIQEIRS
jgi:hypothetical protein